MIVTPKKPNSARRSNVKVKLVFFKNVISFIPGIGHSLKKHSLVLIHRGRARDLPGVYYRCVRGKFDLLPVVNRVSRRSIYGIKKNVGLSVRKKKTINLA